MIATCNSFISVVPHSTVYQRQSYGFAENANHSRCQALNHVQYAKYCVGVQFRFVTSGSGEVVFHM